MSTQGEHQFEEEVLVSGENLDSYNAGEDLTIREPVGYSGDFEVSASAAGEGDFVGVVLYDVSSGEEVGVAKRDCEVRIEVSETVTAGDELLPDGSGAFETVATSTGSSGVAIATEGGSANDVIVAEIVTAQGVTA